MLAYGTVSHIVVNAAQRPVSPRKINDVARRLQGPRWLASAKAVFLG